MLFEHLGIDYHKDSEVPAIILDNGLINYHGWFHFVGGFIGKDCMEKIDANTFTFNLTTISKDFSIGFHYANDLSFFPADAKTVQVEFNALVRT